MPPHIAKYAIWPIAIAVVVLYVTAGGGETDVTVFMASMLTAFFFTVAFVACLRGEEEGRLVNAMGIVALVAIILTVVFGLRVV